MSAVTPGQAACVAWNEHYAEEHGIEARNEWAASDPRGRGAWEAAAKAAITAGAPAELAAAMAETRRLRERIGRLLGMLGHNGSGYTLRLSGVSLAREYRDAGLPLPGRLSHLEGQ